MTDSLIRNINSLPPLSKTIQEIQRIYNDPEGTIADITDVVQQDPMIVANLLKIANSPLYNFGVEIKNARQAVSLFGMSLTRSVVLGSSVRKLLNVDMEPYGIDADTLVKYSNFQAAFGFEWYKGINKSIAEQLHLCAFLYNVGKIIIASATLQNNEGMEFQADIELCSDIAEVEKAYVDATTAEVTAAVFEHWKFDELLVKAIKHVDNATQNESELSRALCVINTLFPINKAFFDEQSLSFGKTKCSETGLDYQKLEQTILAFKEKSSL